MKILKVGDKSKAICQDCKSLVGTTFKLRNVPFSDGSGIVKNILAGVCDECDRVVAIPHQSTPAIKKAHEAKRKPVEVRLPAHMIDILNLATSEIGAETDFVPSLVKYYIHALSINEKSASTIANYLKTELASGKSEKRLSLKGSKILDELNLLKSLSHIDNTTDMMKSVILKIHEDLLVNKSAKPIKQLQGIMAAVA